MFFAKDSGVVTVTRSNPVIVNKGEGAPDVLLLHSVGQLMSMMGTHGRLKTHLLD